MGGAYAAYAKIYESLSKKYARFPNVRLRDISGGIFIWGAGVHTAQLLDRTGLLAHAEILGVVDRDSQKWGHTQAECPIISPDDFLKRRGTEPVVISSFASEMEIANNLRQNGIAEERIVRLYN